MNHDLEESKELEHFKYEGNAIPRVLRLAWTLFVVFGLGYMAIYAWPDLKEWISKL